MLQWKTTKESVHAQIAGRSLDFNEAGVYYLYKVGEMVWITSLTNAVITRLQWHY